MYIEALDTRIEIIAAEQAKLIQSLQEENALLREAYRSIEERNAFLEASNCLLAEKVALLEAKVQGTLLLEAEVNRLKEIILKLERRLSTNSTNSSKPPSSDGVDKKGRHPLSSRGKGKSKGGQKGHAGKTMEQVPNPDQVIVHPVQTCCECGADLSQAPVSEIVKRQVFDVIIQRVVTEHQAEVKRCSCKACTTASFPIGVKGPVQIGENLRAITLYLSEQFIGKDRLSQVVEDLFSVSISDTTILKYEAELAENLKDFQQEVLSYLTQTKVKHADETGIRVGGKTQWMHTLCDTFLTCLWHQPKRSCQLSGLAGILVHDHYQSYLKLPKLTHAFCNAHILRELKGLIEYEKEPWASEMWLLLQKMCHAKTAGELNDNRIKRFQELYDKIVDRGLNYHEQLSLLPKPAKGKMKRRKGHNLAIRLKNFKSGTLLFLSQEEVPFTNNQAERDLRMVKVKQKVSGGFRTQEGVENFATIRSYISTVRKNGGNVFESIKMALREKVHLFQIFKPYNPPLLALASPP